jgi:hypothetical protein
MYLYVALHFMKLFENNYNLCRLSLRTKLLRSLHEYLYVFCESIFKFVTPNRLAFLFFCTSLIHVHRLNFLVGCRPALCFIPYLFVFHLIISYLKIVLISPFVIEFRFNSSPVLLIGISGYFSLNVSLNTTCSLKAASVRNIYVYLLFLYV